jgi:hypothetical protein
MNKGESFLKPGPWAAAIEDFIPAIEAARAIDGSDAALPADVVNRLAAKHNLTTHDVTALGTVATGMLDRTEYDGIEESFYGTPR